MKYTHSSMLPESWKDPPGLSVCFVFQSYMGIEKSYCQLFTPLLQLAQKPPGQINLAKKHPWNRMQSGDEERWGIGEVIHCPWLLLLPPLVVIKWVSPHSSVRSTRARKPATDWMIDVNKTLGTQNRACKGIHRWCNWLSELEHHSYNHHCWTSPKTACLP